MNHQANMGEESGAEEDALATITVDVLAYLNHAPTSDFNDQSAQVVDQWEGRDNLLWRVTAHAVHQDAVLKLYLDAGQARCRRQFDGQQTFAPLGIAPHPLWYDRYPQGLSRQILVYEWTPGQPLDGADPTHMTALAQVVAQVHGGDLDVMRRFSPNPLNLDTLWRVLEGSVLHSGKWLALHSQKLSILFQQIAASAHKIVESALPLWHSAPPTPVHGDLKLENALFNLGAAVLLDWEMFGLGDPALDAASFLYWNRREISGDARDIWLDAYLARSDQVHIAERISLYERILPFQTLCYLLDGLRTLSSEQIGSLDDGQAQGSATLGFLQETLQSSLVEAAVAVGKKPGNQAELVSELFGAFGAKQRE